MMGERAEKQTGENLIGKGQPGPGRPKGVPNKNTAIIKDMIVQALDAAGGVEYLTRQARENPGPFMTLLGKVLPMQVTGADGGPIKVDASPLAAARKIAFALAMGLRAAAAQVEDGSDLA